MRGDVAFLQRFERADDVPCEFFKRGDLPRKASANAAARPKRPKPARARLR
jgi:hypothetical protein